MLRIPEITEKIKRRFFKYVEKTDGCWLWTGTTINKGKEGREYGRFRIRHRKFLAHRLSWSIHYGDIPESCEVLHSCDNPRCVNPTHLVAGSHLDNMLDMSVKNRSASAENNPNTFLTWEQVREIRRKYVPRVYTTRQLAEEYGIDPGALFRILKHVTWKERP